MRVHVVNVLRGDPDVAGKTLDRFASFARGVEERGFDGLWLTDSFGRGRPTMDPIVLMSVAATVTSKVEIGTCVLQVPVRHPVELAHRCESLHALLGHRLMLGLGCGSTKADFDLVGEDYEARFKTLMSSLEIMREAWAGNEVAGGRLTPWPGTEGGPNLMLGAWRNKRWIVYAAERCAGWIASGLYSQPEELEAGVKFYRDAGGKRAVLSNVIVELQGDIASMPLAGRATMQITSAEEALDRLRRIRAVGFDDVLCMVRPEGLDDLARLRDQL
ncbi:MAG TPA: LLM class flavin-dependent oxidoreductase [Stellaceae bacterium]|jgi:alkanesulfonate monooxygenase SsuD/methylene tetrahydromethanopterin reductase-like flavin-dependent oxidoreductase (luciferase family)|nr:LLM class flavin-dependent oxidoreductase [Stellaceae bacterium]